VNSEKNPTGATGALPLTILLHRYRTRLIALVEAAEAAAPAEPGELRAAVDQLVDELNANLLTLYRAAERGGLKAREAAILVPTLERLRNVLRRRDVRLCSMRDTLHKAVMTVPTASQSAPDAAGLGSS
jgi:hypothetical protein